MTTLQEISKKILNHQTLPPALLTWNSKKYKIVFTNGCFDLIHRGHIDYLAKAADMGDILIVGLNSDDSVRKLKGSNRPVQDQESRSLILASLSFVSAVVVFTEDTPYNLISLIKPGILVKGADYKIKDIVGFDIVTGHGGKVETIEYLPGCSTSAIISKINSDGKD